jgi:hypothetical protein
MSKEANQSRKDQAGGGNVVGKAPGGRLHQPGSRALGTDGKSGQTQSTNRGPKGK